MTPNVVIAEDDEPLLDLLQYNMERAGYTAVTARRGDDAESKVTEFKPDLLLLDWMLPGLSGIELCRRLRQNVHTRSLPVIMLTARAEEADKICGFETGADDYLTKPFSVRELMARVAVLLRLARQGATTDVVKVGDIELNRSRMVVLHRGRPVHLRLTDCRLLEFMMQAAGRVLSLAQLREGVWGNEVHVDERTLDAYVDRLRGALVRGWRTDPIRPVRGAGYSFEC